MRDIDAQLDRALGECRDVLAAYSVAYWSQRFDALRRWPLSAARRADAALAWLAVANVGNGDPVSGDPVSSSGNGANFREEVQRLRIVLAGIAERTRLG